MKKIFSSFIILFAFGCVKHPKEGWIVKAPDGKLYQLEAFDDFSESYKLKEIDTAFINHNLPK